MAKLKVKPGSPPALAEEFRRLHAPGSGLLVCPAAWDAASARIFQDCGAKAVVTTSLGVANTLGYADGESFFPVDESVAMTRRIVASVDVPVSVDAEGGYGDPEGTAQALIEAGAVGLNIEDRLGEETKPIALEVAAARVAAVRERADRIGFPLFINARTDTLACGGDVDDAVTRLNAYLAAGAECALPFLPGELRTPETIRELTSRIKGPVNLGGSSTKPTVQELEQLGVRRLSLTFYWPTYGLVRSLAQQLLDEGSLELMSAQQPYMEVNNIFRARARR